MPKNATTSRSGKRFYVWGRGERYWSVTTILGALPKDALKFWAAKTVAEFAFDRSSTWFTMSRDEAVAWLKSEPLRYTAGRANLGTAIHESAEAFALGRPAKTRFEMDEEREAIGHFMNWIETMNPRFVMTEASVYNRTQKYAGTLDAIVEIGFGTILEMVGGNEGLIPWQPAGDNDFVRLLVDYKTGGSVEEGKGVYPDVALQLAAYAHAEFVGAPNGSEVGLPHIDGAAVLHVNRSGWRFVPVDALRPEVFKAFLYTREVFRWLEVISKDVLGTPLEPAAAQIAERHAAPDRTDETPPAVVDESIPPPARNRARKAT